MSRTFKFLSFAPLALLLFSWNSHPLAAAEVEGVTENHSTVHALKPEIREPGTDPVDTPDAAKRSFSRARIPAGFKADLWAAEPMLANPVAFSFDGRGRMFVAETHRYRTSVLDIRHYMFMLEDDLANRNQDDWIKSIKKNFPDDWQQLGVESEVVRLLEDTNHNGKADKTSVYADGFHSLTDGIASGVMARPDGIWLANIPGLYKLSGRNPDGKTAAKEEIFRGFGIRFNYTGHDLHGLIKGPDGRIYFSIGDRGTSVKTKEGTLLEVADEGAIFRCEEDGSHLELVMRGLRNPQEMAFDDNGNLFACDNDSDQGDRERLVQVLEGGDAGWRVGYQHSPQPAERNPWLAEHQWEPREAGKNQPARILSPLANMPDGPGGLVHYPGTGLSDKYKGCFFLACYKGSSSTSQVAVFRPKPDGAGFQLEFLENFIPGCQATDVDFGPDSRLYVSFWDEGWARTAQGRIMQVEEPEARKAQAAQIADVQRILGEGMKDRNVESLIKLLARGDQRVRLEAQWEIADRMSHGNAADEGFSALTDVILNSKDRLPRLHAIQALGHVLRLAHRGQLAANSNFVMRTPEDAALGALFEDPDEEIRAACLKVIAQQPAPFDAPLDSIVRGKLTDASPRVRLAAAQAAGKHGGVESVRPLLDLARAESGKSEALRHVTAYALAQISTRSPEARNRLQQATWDKDAKVRMTALLAFGMAGPESAAQIANFLPDADPAIVREAIGLLSDRGLETATDGKWVGKMSLFAESSGDTMTELRGLNARFRAGGQLHADNLMLRILDRGHPLSPELRVEALKMLAQWEHPAPRDRLVGIYRPVPDGSHTRGQAVSAFLCLTSDVIDSDPSVTLQALETARALKVTNWNALCAGYASDEARPQAVRLKALQVLAELDGPQLPETLKTLITDKTSGVRIAAAGLIGKSDPALAARGFSDSLADGTAASSRAVFTALASLHAPETDRILTGQLNLLTEGKVPAPARLELLEAARKSAGPAVREALSKYQDSLPKDDLLAPFYPALEGGDAMAGRTIFREHAVAACLRCHQIEGSGGEAGPALDGLAARMDRRTILESIVEPNAKIAEGFQMAVFTLKDGTALAGAVKSETENAVVLQAVGSDPVTMEKAKIDRRDNVPSGMMPGLGLLLTQRELRDIVEYCASLVPAK